MFKKIIFLSTLASMSLQAWMHPETGQFSLEGQVLWLQAALEDTYFAIGGSSPTVANGTRFSETFNFHPAYRLRGSYAFCDEIEMSLQGMYFSNSVSSSERGSIDTSPLFPTQLPAPVDFALNDGIADFAQSDIHVRYYSVDALINQTLYSCCPFHLGIEAGLHYFNLRSGEAYSYTSTGPLLGFANYDDHLWGIGPEIGFDIQYLLPSFLCCDKGDLSFVADVKGALLATRNRASVNSNLSPASFFLYDFSNNSSWRVIPAGEIELGFSYLLPCRCFTFSLEAGYDLEIYQKAINKVRVLPPSVGFLPAISVDRYGDFVLHGPYLAVGFSY